ncbi:MAG: hypothetical protein BWY87_01159 [Deltaproteobacteria bacterium ADurb.Bin510]|nr:MAG: hypothetical protein BWY87_01159 [Deltaproteobacteria bacterium ADurb.Bin510]
MAHDAVFLAAVGGLHFAHDLGHDVAQGDQARDVTELVDDDGQFVALGLELAQQVGQAFALGHAVGRPHQLAGADVAAALGPAAQQVLGVHHAQDVVHGLLENRNARAAFFQKEPHQLVQAGVLVDRDHVGLGHHDLAHRGVLEHQDVVDHVALFLVDEAALLDLVEQFVDFLLGGGGIDLGAAQAVPEAFEETLFLFRGCAQVSDSLRCPVIP